MSNLNNNTASLEAILQTINNLPEANVDPILQYKTVSPSTSSQTITADDGYDGLDTVIVNAIPTVTQASPSISINSSTGKITASVTQNEGYVVEGTKTATKTLTTQAAKTITPSTSAQTAVAKNVYTTGAVTVAAIPSEYESVGAETTAYTTELSDLEAQISALESALEGKAAGGGAVETCTVTVMANNGSATIYAIDYVAVDDSGNIVYECITPNSTGTQTLTCVCGSHVVISNSSESANSTSDSNLIFHRPYLSIFKVSDSETMTANANLFMSSGGGV